MINIRRSAERVKLMDTEAGEANGNPAIERMMKIFATIERQPEGAPFRDIVERTGIARSTVYRLLNSLESHRMVQQLPDGSYCLGARLLELADNVTVASRFFKFTRFIQPALDRLATITGETCKVSVIERDAIILVAGSTGRSLHAFSYTLGELLPPHAGGASKVLMANLSEDARDRMLPRQLVAFTPRTLTTRQELEAEYARVRAQGWSHDPGEYSLNVLSYAAPIGGPNGEVAAALSITFMAGADDAYKERIRQAAISGAADISTTIAGKLP